MINHLSDLIFFFFFPIFFWLSKKKKNCNNRNDFKRSFRSFFSKKKKNKISSSSEIARFGCLSADSKHCVYQRKYVLDLDVRFVRRFAYAQRRAYTHCRRLCADYASIIAPGYAPIYKRHEQLTVDPLLLFIKPSTTKRKNCGGRAGRQAGISCGTISPTSIRIRMTIRFHRFHEEISSFSLFFSLYLVHVETNAKIFSLFFFFPLFRSFFCKRDLTTWRIFSVID